MPIKICPDCGGKVSESRNECIHCGYLFTPKPKKNIALILLWAFLGWTALAYLVNMIIALDVGGELKWMFEYIEYGYIAGFICMGVGIIGYITSLVFLYIDKRTKIKTKISRIISLILMTVILFVTVAPVIFYDPLTYTKNDNNTYTVRHCSRKYSGDVKIPSTYNGLPVVAIADYAFLNCIYVESVEIEAGLTIIGDYAFNGCVNLKSVEIGEGVTIIGNFFAFTYCSSLESVVIPVSTTCIGLSTFSGCTSLKSVYYKGTEESWNNITIVPDYTELLNATRYYYSESEPTGEGNYWHYDNNGNVAVWQ